MEYVQWRNFSKVLDIAKLVCLNSGGNVEDHFAEVSKTIKMPKNAENQEYAEFQNAGYMGLYGGLTVEDIHTKKNLKENVKTKQKANQTHYTVGTTVRKAIKDIGGTMPEDLPKPEKSIKQIEKEQLKRLKSKKTKLMLDE